MRGRAQCLLCSEKDGDGKKGNQKGKKGKDKKEKGKKKKKAKKGKGEEVSWASKQTM